jgi:hypothetical protein
MNFSNDLELPQVKKLIEFARPLSQEKEKFWLTQYLQLQSLNIYFHYATTLVRIQEENLKLMENGEHKNFSSHEAYAESELRIYSSALGAYAHMRTCLHFARKLSEAIPNDKNLEDFRKDQKEWAKNLIDKRDKLQAHPYQGWAQVWKRNMRSSDGKIGFPVRNLIDPTKNLELIINPREDLEILRKYLEKLMVHLERIYQKQKLKTNGLK